LDITLALKNCYGIDGKVDAEISPAMLGAGRISRWGGGRTIGLAKLFLNLGPQRSD
jgi:hypothetical protein